VSQFAYVFANFSDAVTESWKKEHSYATQCMLICSFVVLTIVISSSFFIFSVVWLDANGHVAGSTPDLWIYLFGGLAIMGILEKSAGCKVEVDFDTQFLRATVGTAIARLSHRSSVCPSIRSSVTCVDQSKTVQARITKSSPSAAWKTLFSGTVKLFHKFEGGHLNNGAKWEGVEKNLRFLANKSLYLRNGAS